MEIKDYDNLKSIVDAVKEVVTDEFTIGTEDYKEEFNVTFSFKKEDGK